MVSKLFVGIDIGGTRCRIVTSNSLERADAIHRHDFVLTHDFDADFATLVNSIREYAHGEPIAGLGMGVPGDLNPEKTIFVDPARNLQEWSHKPLKAMLEQELKCPVLLENDGVTAALGEAYFGLGKTKDFTFVIWGTGVGGAKIQHVGDKIVYTELDWYKDCEEWEHVCGGNEILRQYGKEASELTDDEWQQVMGGFHEQLVAFIERTGSRFIVFGGGIALKQKHRLMEVAKNFDEVEIRVSHIGEDAGLYGALALLRH